MRKGLKIVGVEQAKDIPVQKLADAVYKTLKQKEKLYAEFLIVDEEEIRRLNRDFRGVDKVTDVLSFPSMDNIRGAAVTIIGHEEEFDDDMNALFIGSVVLCLTRAKEQAAEYGHSLLREETYLLCHGLLHLMGYDHIRDEDKAEMRKLEDEIMSDIGVTRE